MYVCTKYMHAHENEHDYTHIYIQSTTHYSKFAMSHKINRKSSDCECMPSAPAVRVL